MINLWCTPVRLLFWGICVLMASAVEVIFWTVKQPPRYVWHALVSFHYCIRQMREAGLRPATGIKKSLMMR